MPEWPNGQVSKTLRGLPHVGSNPTPTAQLFILRKTVYNTIMTTYLKLFGTALTLFIVIFWGLVIAAPTSAQVVSPNSNNNPVVWKTNYAKLASSNFYIRIGNKYFYGVEPVSLHSDPGDQKTTLEMSWTENGTKMRMNMYFQMKDGLEWELYDLRTANAGTGDWIYFSPRDSLGNQISSLRNQQNYAVERRFLPAANSSGIDAEIFCGECSINAFLDLPLSYSAQGYALEVMTGLPANETITLLANSSIGYGVNVLLRNSNREVVTNQANMEYEWASWNENIAKVYPDIIQYESGGCAYNIQEPCPRMNGQIAGINPGVTKIQVSVRKDGYVLASTEFDVKVSKDSLPFSSPSSSPVAESTPLPVDDDSLTDAQLRQEIENLKGTVGEIELSVAQQGSQLNLLQQLVESIRRFLTRFFRFGKQS